jgi:hypothetical protein
MRTQPPIKISITLVGLLLASAYSAHAQNGDASLFSASGGAPPNILLLLDSSGSMGKEPSDVGSCVGDCRKRDMANIAIRDLVTAVNPPDGDGGFVNNARFGFAIFTKAGARLLVPVGEDNVDEIVDWVTLPSLPAAADNINGLGGNSHGLAMLEMARYLAHDPVYKPTNSFGPLPPFGFAEASYAGDGYPAFWPDVTVEAAPGDFLFEDPTLPSVWDLACRPTFLVHVDDGLWGGNDGDRFGTCADLDGDGASETCPLEFIGDASGDGNFWMEDISKKMFETDFAPQFPGVQNVVVHVITFDDPASAPLMQVVADVGGGTFHYAVSGDDLGAALFAITVNIFESQASFAGVTVPASRTSSGSTLYNAYFEPRSNQSIWAGHLEAWGLASDGTIVDASVPSVPATDPITNKFIEPRNPYWDAGVELLSNTSRIIYATSPTTGQQVILNTANISIEDLELGSAPPPEPPPPDVCAPVASSVPAGWDFQLISPATLPDVIPGEKVKLSYCVDASRKGVKKDRIGTFPLDGEGTDAIELKERKGDKDDDICPKYKNVDLAVGLEEQQIQIRYYLADDLSPDGLAGWSDSICVTSDGGGAPAPPVSPDFAPYPNASTSGINTYAALQAAVIDFTYGKDAFDQNANGTTTENRDVVLGDIFHSSPMVVGQPTTLLHSEDGYSNFQDAYNTRDRVLYAGANDGMLHAFHAGDFHPDDPGTVPNEGDDPATSETEFGYYDQGTGTELFGYIPAILVPKLKLLSHNVPRTQYFVDASSVVGEVWLGDGSGSDITKTTDEWATVLINGLRAGGPGYFALDISDPAAGDLDAHGPYPKMLWEYTNAKLGETWSEPIITRVKLSGSFGSGDHCGVADGDGDCLERWVAIFSAGYDSTGDPNHFNYKSDPTSVEWSDRGKALFMVALDTGELLASVEFDDTGSDGPSDMRFAIPSTPAVLDIDFDGFVDVVYVGDLGGQVWKWDVQALGENTDADPLIDNWTAGVFFRTDPVVLDSAEIRYRSFFYPPAAAFEKGTLTLAFGSGEREDLRYAGDPDADDNNRFFVVRDVFPTGASAFASVTTESDLTDTTQISVDDDHSDAGFLFTVTDGEKFVTNVTIFAGYVIVASYNPEASVGGDECSIGGGEAFLYVFDLGTSEGLFINALTPEDPEEDRRHSLDGGLPSSPKISIAADPDDDRVYIKTSTGQIIAMDLDLRKGSPISRLYWRLMQ